MHAKWSKYNIKLRDEFHCQYCNKRFSSRSLTIDHVNPKASGGKHSWTNLVAACKPCNQKKKHHLIMMPLHKPIRPTYYQLAKKMLKEKSITNPDWKDYTKHLEGKND
jgi:5-methylcytosine-specific restriction endonuclease McrA